MPGEVIDKLEAHLAGTASNYTIDWYPGTQHGLAFVERADVFDRVSAERLWNRPLLMNELVDLTNCLLA